MIHLKVFRVENTIHAQKNNCLIAGGKDAAKAEAEAAKTAMKNAQKEGISKAVKRGKLALQEIAEDFDVPLAFVEALAKAKE